MKKVLYKILILLLVILVLNNFLCSSLGPINVVYADDDDEEEEPEDIIDGILGSVIGIFTYIPKIMALGLGVALKAITAIVAYGQGGEIGDDGSIASPTSVLTITPFDIFFNKVAIIDINFFNVKTDSPVITKIRTSIASWYYVMRNLAAAILLVVLIYIGIRMALSTVASEKAMYKKMLVDWVCSLALIFLLHYIAIFTIEANSALLKMIEGASAEDPQQLEETIHELGVIGFSGISLNSLSAAVVYCMIVFQTFGLLLSYFTRMLKIGFLLIIAPLITLTYSIDKIGDGKAQALGNWLKEFVFTVLIQPFHAIIYVAFVSMALNLVATSGTSLGERNQMAGALLAVLCLKFTKEAENIVRKIFAFKNENDGAGSIAGGMAMSAMAVGVAKNVGKGTRTAINQAGNIAGKMSDAHLGLHAALIAARTSGSKGGGENGQEEMSFADREAAAREDLEAKREAKRIERSNRKYKGGKKNTRKEIQDRAEEIKKASQAKGEKITTSQAMARARLQLANENKKKIEASGSQPKRSRTIKGARRIKALSNAVNVAKSIAKSDTFKFLKRTTTAAGVGLFIGSGAYGSGQNMSAAIATGIAVGKSTEELFKNTAKSFRDDIGERLGSMGISNQEDANKALNDIILSGQQENGEYYSNQLQRILKTIENQLKAAGLDGKEVKDVRHSIQNSITKDLTKNPGADIETVAARAIQAAESNKAFAGLSDEAKAGLQKPLESFASVNQQSAIYGSISSATDVGIDPNRLVDMTSRIFRNGTSSSRKFNEEQYAEDIKDLGDSSLEFASKTLGERNQELESEKAGFEAKQKEIEQQIEEATMFEGLQGLPTDTEELTKKLEDVEELIKEANKQIEENSRKIEILEAEQAKRKAEEAKKGEEQNPEEQAPSGPEAPIPERPLPGGTNTEGPNPGSPVNFGNPVPGNTDPNTPPDGDNQ